MGGGNTQKKAKKGGEGNPVKGKKLNGEKERRPSKELRKK